MRNITTVLMLVLVTAGSSVFAQKSQQNYDKEKLEAARVAFITNRLDLKPEQAEKFWPLFNEYNDHRNQIMDDLSSINRSTSNEANEKSAQDMINKRLNLQQKLLDREKEFMDEITKVINPTQALKLGGVSREFTKQVFRMQRGKEKEK